MGKLGISNSYVRNFLAELLGTFLLVVFGDGAIAQVTLDRDGGFLNICIGYGLALMIGILASGGVSGGHLNPAVTVAMALLGKVKLLQVPVYILGQFIGAFLAAAVVLGVYADAINTADVNWSLTTAGIFASYPRFNTVSTITLVMDQILGTALLLIIILAVTDSRNMKVICCSSFGLNSGCAINPARDFAPRLLSLIAGFGTETFTVGNYFFWIPLLMPFLGAAIGAAIYQLMVALHHTDEE
ncbi:aquaporin-9 [Eurytemora carolleeae]|uniref:aquaporin-9 n=1 Tax=Eurytemora carolleeae TaxID=1294199 RepID=UPI000C77E07E|nr:aquaporin-9 [Eurytemora carolleeae]|eukprot:XP_023326998.1 aquaporin-9-like [Eurytemora affinis]